MDAPLLSAAGLCWAATDAGSRFHSELCTALPPVPPPTRAQPRPPTRTTAPQEDAVQKCAKFRQSPRNWHTRAAAAWCCRETGVRRGDGGWCRAVKMEMRCAMVRRSHHGPWTLELRTKVIRRFTKIPQSRRRVGYHSVLSHLSLYNCVGIPISLTTTYHGVNVCLA